MRNAIRCSSPLRLAILAAMLVPAIGAAKTPPAAVARGGYLPTDAERARWTMSDMRSLATALEAYAIDNHKTYPAALTIDALVPLIQPSYMRKAHATDAWGRSYVYVSAHDRTSYQLVSAGSDGKTDSNTWATAGMLADFDEDAVVDSGSVTRPWPFR
jgi:hypothetical protein